MKCNNCGVDMEKGRVGLGATALGFLVIGFSYKHLFFWGEGKSPAQKELVLMNGRDKESYKCPNCKTITLVGTEESKSKNSLNASENNPKEQNEKTKPLTPY